MIAIKFINFLKVLVPLTLILFSDGLNPFSKEGAGENLELEWFDMTSEVIDIPVNQVGSGTEGKSILELLEDDKYIRSIYGSLMEADDKTSLHETIQSALLDYDHRFLILYIGDNIDELEEIIADAYYSNPMILGTVLYLQYGMEESKEGEYYLHFDVYDK